MQTSFTEITISGRPALIGPDGRPISCRRKRQKPEKVKMTISELYRLFSEQGLPPPPRTRKECKTVPRPCPYYCCRNNLLSQIQKNGTVKIYKSNQVESCSLDVAEQGEHTLEEVGALMGNICRERIRQIEESALEKLHKLLSDAGYND